MDIQDTRMHKKWVDLMLSDLVTIPMGTKPERRGPSAETSACLY